jgi:hypothetical protein
MSNNQISMDSSRKNAGGDIRAQGPIKSANADLIDKEFWRFTLPDANGNAFNLSSLKRIHWFEVSAEDVLSVWPPEGSGP